MRAQRSTVLRWFRVIKRCGYRETNNFLFLVPSPKIILGRTGGGGGGGGGGLGTVDFHTSEQWTFDIIHCYLRLK